MDVYRIMRRVESDTHMITRVLSWISSFPTMCFSDVFFSKGGFPRKVSERSPGRPSRSSSSTEYQPRPNSPRTTSARPAGKRSRGDYFFMVKSQLSGEGKEVVKHDAVGSDAEHAAAPRVVARALPVPNATFPGRNSSADSSLTDSREETACARHSENGSSVSVAAVPAAAALPSTPLAASDGVDTTIASFLDLPGREAPPQSRGGEKMAPMSGERAEPVSGQTTYGAANERVPRRVRVVVPAIFGAATG